MKTGLKICGAFSMVIASTLVVACGAGDMSEFDVAEGDMLEEGGYSEELGSLEQGLHSCITPDGTNSVMAALAVAAAQDLGRWRAGLDFEVAGDRIRLASGTGTDGKPKGKSRCSGSVCKRIEPLLALQNDNATGVYVQAESANSKVLVNPSALRSRMKAKLEEQLTKDREAQDGYGNAPPKTPFALTGAGSTSLSGGCGTHFKFNVKYDAPVTPPKTPTIAQIKNSLYFADQANGWVDFRDLGNNVVAIDPTYGLNDGAVSTAGSCEVACTKISPNADISNACCSCGGVAKTFKKAAFNASVFLCQ